MPSAICEIIEQREDCSFRDFALRAARATGALIHQRDDSLDVEIRHREPTAYYAEELQKAKARLVELQGMTMAQAEALSAAEYASDMKRYDEAKKSYAVILARYDKMRAKVERWQPPTPEHEKFKELLLEQISENLPTNPDQWKPGRRSAALWLREETARMEGEVAWYSARTEDDARYCAEANAYLDALVRSLPPA